MDFDKSLEAVGELGLWHALVLMLLIPAALLPGMWSVLFVFSGYVSKHRYLWYHFAFDKIFETVMLSDALFLAVMTLKVNLRNLG